MRQDTFLPSSSPFLYPNTLSVTWGAALASGAMHGHPGRGVASVHRPSTQAAAGWRQAGIRRPSQAPSAQITYSTRCRGREHAGGCKGDLEGGERARTLLTIWMIPEELMSTTELFFSSTRAADSPPPSLSSSAQYAVLAWRASASCSSFSAWLQQPQQVGTIGSGCHWWLSLVVRMQTVHEHSSHCLNPMHSSNAHTDQGIN
jgi:hypothetical protein